MKEHRVRALRVTTPGNIASREREDAGQPDDGRDDSLWGVQLLQLQLELGPASRPGRPGLQDDVKAPRPWMGVPAVLAPVPSPAPAPATPAPADSASNKDSSDHRRPPCSICGPSHGAQQQVKRRSPLLQRRDQPASPPRQTPSDAVEQVTAANPAPRGATPACVCEGPCVQPLLHLLSGDLDHSWASVLLALRLLVADPTPIPAPAAGDGVVVVVNGVSVSRCRVRACGREATRTSTASSCWLAGRDAAGHTPLLLAGRRLLSAGRWADAAQVVALLLSAGSDANAVNREGRSLLSYAVAALDEAADTTRLLLNHGANVWGAGPVDSVLEAAPPCLRSPAARPAMTPSPSCSPQPSPSPVFAWFLRAVIRRRRLDEGCLRTLALVSAAMAERPRAMHGLVLRTMFRHSRCYRVLGPVFLQIKTAMARHWSKPQDLRALCRRAIRRAVGEAVGSSRLNDGVRALGLPIPLQQYLLLYS